MIDLFITSLLLSVVLVGIHAYFGREIVKRGIIFTDIAVAQFSGVGIALSLFFFHGEYIYPISLSFALFASLLIALSQRIKEYTEAFIGLLYSFGFSLTVLILSFSAFGMEELKKITASDILFVERQSVLLNSLFSTLNLIKLAVAGTVIIVMYGFMFYLLYKIQQMARGG